MPIVHRLAERFDLTALHQSNPSRYPYLLQSTAQATDQNHFDILFAFPLETLSLTQHGKLEWQQAPDEAIGNQPSISRELDTANNDFLTAFDHCWQTEQASSADPETTTRQVPFKGGWFLFLGYEVAQQIEPSLQLPVNKADNLPAAFASRIPAAVAIDRQSQAVSIVVEPGYEACIDAIEKDIAQMINGSRQQASSPSDQQSIIKSIQEEPAQRYIDGVKQVKRYIKDGDVFQVNLSRWWQAELAGDISHAQIYRRLMQSNPSPFAALATIGNNAIISSSPERLVRVRGNRVETRPIAGTRPRGQSANEDESYLKELIGHPKERAEHIMLIDLERNDLGRVCVPGSINVNELMALETYAHVHHIVSNVQGELQKDTTPSDVIRAVFPGGTITGCPKVRCMEIIGELEQAPRNAYTGSLGYVNHDGSMDLNILIRTLARHGDRVSLRAGAGIVADSDPENELQETRAKAKGLLLAL
jgi:anthranilate synthase component 1